MSTSLPPPPSDAPQPSSKPSSTTTYLHFIPTTPTTMPPIIIPLAAIAIGLTTGITAVTLALTTKNCLPRRIRLPARRSTKAYKTNPSAPAIYETPQQRSIPPAAESAAEILRQTIDAVLDNWPKNLGKGGGLLQTQLLSLSMATLGIVADALWEAPATDWRAGCREFVGSWEGGVKGLVGAGEEDLRLLGCLYEVVVREVVVVTTALEEGMWVKMEGEAGWEFL